MLRIAALALLLVPALTHAQEAPIAGAPGATDAAALTVKAHLVYSGTTDYPLELASQGVQGTATVRASLAADGSLSNPVIAESSRSQDLDRSALAVVPTLKLKLDPAAGRPAEVVVPVLFLKDSVSNLHDKTCAEFNVDHDYFARTFPEKEASDMTVFNMATGVAYATAMAHPLEFIKKLKPARAHTVKKCAASPKAKFIEVYLKALR